jgi:hypothetical protein
MPGLTQLSIGLTLMCTHSIINNLTFFSSCLPVETEDVELSCSNISLEMQWSLSNDFLRFNILNLSINLI